MKVAYVDTSCLVAIAFGELGTWEIAEKLEEYDMLVSSSLLEAELRAALAREGVSGDAPMLGRITWVFPDRRLTEEMDRVLQLGHVPAADLWHLAVALYLAETPRDVDFLTLDVALGEAAARVGFTVPT